MSEKKLLVVPALLKAHVDQYVKKDGTVVQAHDDKRQAAAPKLPATWREAHDHAVESSDSAWNGGGVSHAHASKALNHASNLHAKAAENAAADGEDSAAAHHTEKSKSLKKMAEKHDQAVGPNSGRGIHHAVAAGLKDHLISGDHDTFKKVAHHLGHPEWKSAPFTSDLDGVDGKKLQEAHDHLYSGKELPQAAAKPSGSPYAAARGEVMMSVGKDYKPAAKKMLDSMEAGGDHAEEFGKYHFGASHEIVKKTLQKHGIDVGGGSKPAGPKPGHMDVSTLAAGHHLFDKNGQKVDEVESVEKHPMGGLKVSTRAGYSHMVSKDGRNDHGLTNKAPGGSSGAKPAGKPTRVLIRKNSAKAAKTGSAAPAKMTNVGTEKWPMHAKTSEKLAAKHEDGSTHHVGGFKAPDVDEHRKIVDGGDHTIQHNGKTYFFTRKTGKNMKSGEDSFEYSSGDSGEHRAWVTRSGHLQDD